MSREHLLHTLSQEEGDFMKWLQEAKELGMVLSFEHQPAPFILSEEVRLKGMAGTKTIWPHTYTPDFLVHFHPEAPKLLKSNRVVLQGNMVFIDTKGTFANPYTGGERAFTINRKWVWKEYKVWVEKVVPKQWFQKTFVPEACRYTLKGEVRKPYLNAPSIEDMRKRWLRVWRG